jgi:hypothetical protein
VKQADDDSSAPRRIKSRTPASGATTKVDVASVAGSTLRFEDESEDDYDYGPPPAHAVINPNPAVDEGKSMPDSDRPGPRSRSSHPDHSSRKRKASASSSMGPALKRSQPSSPPHSAAAPPAPVAAADDPSWSDVDVAPVPAKVEQHSDEDEEWVAHDARGGPAWVPDNPTDPGISFTDFGNMNVG